MSGQPVGGDPEGIEAGARQLRGPQHAIEAAGPAVNRSCSAAGAGAGNGTLTAALDRFGAAWSQLCADVAVQLAAAATLAQNGSRDLASAGGPRRAE